MLDTVCMTSLLHPAYKPTGLEMSVFSSAKPFLSLSHLNQICSVTGRLGFRTKVFASYICSEQNDQNREDLVGGFTPRLRLSPAWHWFNQIDQNKTEFESKICLCMLWSVRVIFLDWDNLNEVSSAAVDADVRQLQADDFTGLCDDERSAGQLWPGRHESEVSVSGQHVQASCKHHIQLWVTLIRTSGSQTFKPLIQK